jgi:hypothetical protein
MTATNEVQTQNVSATIQTSVYCLQKRGLGWMHPAHARKQPTTRQYLAPSDNPTYIK